MSSRACECQSEFPEEKGRNCGRRTVKQKKEHFMVGKMARGRSKRVIFKWMVEK
jgi:hypothetical protein